MTAPTWQPVTVSLRDLKPWPRNLRRANALRVPEAQQTMTHRFGSRTLVPAARSCKGMFRLPGACPAANSPGVRTSTIWAPCCSSAGILLRARNDERMRQAK